MYGSRKKALLWKAQEKGQWGDCKCNLKYVFSSEKLIPICEKDEIEGTSFESVDYLFIACKVMVINFAQYT